MADTLKHIEDSSFVEEISKGVTLVDFYADWCGPCRMLTPVLEKVAKELGGQAKIVKVNVDTAQATSSQYQISSIPTMILFKDGKKVDQLMGLQNEAAIKKFILSAVSTT